MCIHTVTTNYNTCVYIPAFGPALRGRGEVDAHHVLHLGELQYYAMTYYNILSYTIITHCILRVVLHCIDYSILHYNVFCATIVHRANTTSPTCRSRTIPRCVTPSLLPWAWLTYQAMAIDKTMPCHQALLAASCSYKRHSSSYADHSTIILLRSLVVVLEVVVVVVVAAVVVVVVVVVPPLTIKYCRIASRPPMLKLITALRIQMCCCLWVSIGVAERSPGSVAEFNLFVVALAIFHCEG